MKTIPRNGKREERKKRVEEERRKKVEEEREKREEEEREKRKNGKERKEEEREEKVKEEIEKLDIGSDLLENGKFRFANQKCMFTYKTHVDKKKYKDWLSTIVPKGRKVKIVHLAHETGDKHHNYLHTHVLVDFGFNFQTKNSRRFDYEQIHPHIKKVLSMKHWKNCLIYLAKEDPANVGLAGEELENLYERILACETNEEAYAKCVKRPNDFFGVQAIRKSLKEEPKHRVIIPDDKMLPWQKAFIKINRQPYENRVINWVIDGKGGCGKTRWAQHMSDNYDNDWVYFNDIGSSSDFGQNIRNCKDAGWTGKGLILDLPRSFVKAPELYKALEGVIDGRITTTKYTGGIIEIGNPFIWVFANFPPNLTSVSLDRWRVLEVLRKGKAVRLRKYGIGKKYTLENICHGPIPLSIWKDVSSSSSGGLEDVSL